MVKKSNVFWILFCLIVLSFYLHETALAGSIDSRGRGLTCIITVDDDGPADYSTIQAAIDAAVDGDEIVAADGRYTGEGNRDIDFLGKAITVRSQNGPENCIIDCEGSSTEYHRGFYFHNGETEDSILDGFTITNGCQVLASYPEGYGGGIGSFDSSPTIKNNIIAGNAAFDGGGIYYNDEGLIQSNTIINNTADRFGGGISSDWGSPIINNNIITDNTTRYGGGIFSRGRATIINNIIKNNSASIWGGGIISWEDDPITIINNIISENRAEEKGGGIMIHETESTIIGNLITSNVCVGDGGGVYLQSRFSEVTNNTIADNSGSGIFCLWNSPTVTNNIIWGNLPEQINGTALVTYSDIDGGWSGGGNINTDPLFVDPANGDYRLQNVSPCIDAGSNTAVPPEVVTDLDGNPRFVDDPDTIDTGSGTPPIVDMGAFEKQTQGPDELISELILEVLSLDLQKGIEKSLVAKLESALQVLDDVNTNNNIAAIKLMQAFINTVERHRGQKIPGNDADALIADAQSIIILLSTKSV